MVYNLPQQHEGLVLVDDEREVLPPVTCPMCHTRAALARSTIEAGRDWLCVRCGQRWDAVRLARVATYAAWAAGHDGVEGLTKGLTVVRDQDQSYRDPPIEPADGAS